MKVGEMKLLLFGIVVILSLLLSSAELNLVISGINEEGKADFFLQTNSKADSSFDAYDLEFPPFPVSLPRIYSIVGDKNMIMDSWPNSDRMIRFVYERANESEDELRLEFSGEVSGTYKVILKDYGSDSAYKNLVGSTSVGDKKSYKTKIESKKTYFELEVDYLFCGDGICSAEEGEDCASCSNDCRENCGDVSPVVSGESLNPFYLLSVSDLEKGIEREFSLDYGYKLHFNNKTYTFSLMSISGDLVVISSENHYLELLEGERISVDLNLDGKDNIELKINSVSESSAEIFIKALGLTGFSEIPEKDRTIKLKGDITVFDEHYTEKKPFNTLKIIFPIVLLFVGVAMFIFGIFLLIKKKSKLKEEEEEMNYMGGRT